MKKIMILAAALSLLVACGGNSEKKSVEAQAKEWEKKLEAAYEKGDYDQAMEIMEDMQEWYNSLSKEDQEKIDNMR